MHSNETEKMYKKGIYNIIKLPRGKTVMWRRGFMLSCSHVNSLSVGGRENLQVGSSRFGLSPQ